MTNPTSTWHVPDRSLLSYVADTGSIVPAA